MKSHCDKCGLPIEVPVITNWEYLSSVIDIGVRKGCEIDDLAFFPHLCARCQPGGFRLLGAVACPR